MPMPWAYRDATKDWRAFLADAKGRLDLTSDNAAYTAVDAVLQVFRRRLTVRQGLAFADLLPACLRALFVFGWDISAQPLPFAARAAMTAEAQTIRPHHNLTPDHVVARALRRHVHQRDLDALLATFPAGAAEFWHVEADDPQDLDRRIV